MLLPVFASLHNRTVGISTAADVVSAVERSYVLPPPSRPNTPTVILSAVEESPPFLILNLISPWQFSDCQPQENAGFRARTTTSFCPVQKEAKRLGQGYTSWSALVSSTTDVTTRSA